MKLLKLSIIRGHAARSEERNLKNALKRDKAIEREAKLIEKFCKRETDVKNIVEQIDTALTALRSKYGSQARWAFLSELDKLDPVTRIMHMLSQRGHVGDYEAEYFRAMYKRYLEVAKNPQDLKSGDNFIPSAMIDIFTKAQFKEKNKIDLNETQSAPAAINNLSVSNVKKYEEIKEEDLSEDYSSELPKIDITYLPLDGGLGGGVARKDLIKWLINGGHIPKREKTVLGDYKLQAKGTDLALILKLGNTNYFVSIAELKLLRLITEAEKNKGSGKNYASATLLPLISDESKPSYEALFEKDCLIDIMTGRAEVRKYKEALDDVGIKIGDMEKYNTRALPTVNPMDKVLQNYPTAHGGHGQLGMIFLLEALNWEDPDDGNRHIKAFYNGDGINNMPNNTIIGWMKREGKPIIMITTNKTPIDKKDGQIGVQIIREKDGTTTIKFRTNIVELAQAKKISMDQEDLFEAMGIAETDAEKANIVRLIAKSLEFNEGSALAFYEMGRANAPFDTGEEKNIERAKLFYALGQIEWQKQLFNTNIALINYNVLSEILKELTDIVGEAKVKEIMIPTLIPNERTKEGLKYIQLDSALATALLNLNAFFETTENDDVKKILRKRRLTSLVTLLNTDESERTEFFIPTKFSFDFWQAICSDYYILDTLTWMLQDTWQLDTTPRYRPLPEYDLKGDNEEPKWWDEVKNLIDCLGNASTRELRSLEIKGRIKIVITPDDAAEDSNIIDSLSNAGSQALRNNRPRPILEGHVQIVNKTGKLVDFTSVDYIDKLQRLTSGLNRGQQLLDASGQIHFRNVRIIIERNGDLTLEALRGKAPVLRDDEVRNLAPAPEHGDGEIQSAV